MEEEEIRQCGLFTSSHLIQKSVRQTTNGQQQRRDGPQKKDLKKYP